MAPDPFHAPDDHALSLPTPEIRAALDEQFARVGRAVGNSTRWLLLSLLAQSERSVDELVALTDVPVASVSAHLKVLREAHLVINRREGRRIIYAVAQDDVNQLCAIIRDVALRALPEVRELVDTYYNAPDTWVETDVEAVISAAQRGDVTIVDLRPVEEYNAGHLLGAVSIPYERLKDDSRAQLPIEKPVVAYCRGPFCTMGVRGVAWLREQGFTATRLPFHIADLRVQNIPVIEEDT